MQAATIVLECLIIIFMSGDMSKITTGVKSVSTGEGKQPVLQEQGLVQLV